MAKKNDTKSKPEVPAKAEPAANTAVPVKAAAPSKKATPAKRAPRPSPVKKKTVAAKARKPAPKKAAPPKALTHTREDVALRAYFIAEKRQSQGLPGDEHQDWIEAERQLSAESRSSRKTSKA